ncbi:MAG: methionyl-tRNA formyltransferase, partial [Hyphomicrobiaceae bacterium]
GLPVETPKTLKSDDALERFRSFQADVTVVVAYGLLLPQPVLDAPKYGCLNFHPSDLPRWRGAAPLQRTIMAGDTETAACVMRMEAGLDTGPVCLKEQVTLSVGMTSGELHDLMARRGGDLLVRALAALERGTLDCTPQSDDGVTYAPKIDKAEARIDWSRPAAEIHNLIRGLSPFPGAWFELERSGKKERIKVLRSAVASESRTDALPGTVTGDDLTIACGTGAVRLLEVQRVGKNPVGAEEFLRGIPLGTGDTVG